MNVKSACALGVACLFAASVAAQETTVKSKTKVDADDANVMMLTGCLEAGDAAGSFVLKNATVAKGEEMRSKSRVEADVEDDETEVESRERAEVERDDDDDVAVGTAGAVTTYQLMPKAGVDLSAHVGHKVQISALEIKAGEGDAEVDVRTKTKVDVDDGPDASVKSRTEAELPRGDSARLTVVSVKHLAGSCTM